MTALDQAFIKAYHQQGATPASAPLAFAKPVHLDEALASGEATRPASTSAVRDAEGGSESISEALEAALSGQGSLLPDTASQAAAGAQPDGTDGADGADGADDAQQAVPARQHSEPARIVSEPVDADLMRRRTLGQKGPLSVDTLGIPGVALPRSEEEPHDDASSADADAHGSAEGLAQQAIDPQSGDGREQGHVDQLGADRTSPVVARLRPLRALLQVDGFAWPPIALRLLETARPQIDLVCDRLVDDHEARGRATLFTNCRQGDGCTLMLLAAAKRLLWRGARVVLVDGDTVNPRLARRLGLLPEIGWQDILDRELPLGEALIESIEDGLTFLPYRDQTGEAESDRSPRGDYTPAQLHAMITELATGFDAVLVDGGSADRLSFGPDAALQAWITAAHRVIVVKSAQSTPSEIAQRVQRQLIETGARELGIIENFARC
jgi:Mrp family chromosome partitioning ATPase